MGRATDRDVKISLRIDYTIRTDAAVGYNGIRKNSKSVLRRRK